MDTALPAPPVALPSPAELALGLAGYTLLGVVGGLGGADPVSAAPSAVVSAGGMLLLTVPALLVAHQYLRLAAPPAAMLAEILRTFVRLGEVALGAVPALVLFSATSALGGPLSVLLLAGLATLGFTLVLHRLTRAEALADGRPRTMSVLAIAWCGLSGLVGLRLLAAFAPHLL